MIIAIGLAILAGLFIIYWRTKTMSEQLTTDIETLRSDIATMLAALPGAISAAVTNALTAAGVDDATAATAIEAIDQSVKDEIAKLSPAPAAEGDQGDGEQAAE